MKRTMKTTIIFLLSALMLLLAACGAPAEGGDSPSASQNKGAQSEGKIYTVGILQYATHPSLDNCYEGFVQGLAEAGLVEGENLKIDFQNAQGETASGDLIAKNMVTSKVDLLCGIATPAAMSCYSAAKDSGIPVIFSAVSDPVSAGIVKSLEAPGVNCTGTADGLNLDGQMKMIRAFLPQAKRIGIIYTASEPNSVTHLKKFEELAPSYGFEIVSVGVSSASEVGTAAANLVASKVDCINNFTDNNVVDNLSTVLHETDAAGIPVFGSEIEQVKNGCMASESLDYVALGKETGRMAAKVLLEGEDAAAMPVSVITDSFPVYSLAVAKELGFEIPVDYSAAEDVSGE